jgi:hypothetical protein
MGTRKTRGNTASGDRMIDPDTAEVVRLRWEPCGGLPPGDGYEVCSGCGWLGEDHPGRTAESGDQDAVLVPVPRRSTPALARAS